MSSAVETAAPKAPKAPRKRHFMVHARTLPSKLATFFGHTPGDWEPLAAYSRIADARVSAHRAVAAPGLLTRGTEAMVRRTHKKLA